MSRSLNAAAGLLLTLVAEPLPADDKPNAPAPDDPLPPGALARLGTSRGSFGHRQPVTHLAFTSDGANLVTGSKDGTVRLWETATGKELRLWTAFKEVVVAVAVSPDGQAVAAADAAGAVRVMSRATGKVLRELKGPPLAVLAWAPDGKTLVASGRGGQVSLWTGDTQAAYSLYAGRQREGSFIVLAPDGQLLASSQHGSFPGVGGPVLQVRQAAGGRQVAEINLAEPSGPAEPSAQTICWAAAFSLDGKYLATSQSLRTPSGAIRITVSNHKLRLWEVATGKEVLSAENVRAAASHLAFSPDGRHLIYGTADALSRKGRIAGEPYLVFLDALTGGELGRLQPDMGTLSSIAFSPTGKTFASAGTDHTVLVWDFTPFQKSTPKFGRSTSKNLGAEEIPSLWAELAGADAGKAYQALSRLVQGGDSVVAYLKNELRPVPLVDAKLLGAWIGELDSDQYPLRQRATANLAKAGALAEVPLRKALEGKISQEFRRRLELLVQKIDRAVPSPQELQMARALTVLERTATPAARDLLSAVANGAPEARLTRQARLALERWPAVLSTNK
jgi:WD40 repeat protein